MRCPAPLVFLMLVVAACARPSPYTLIVGAGDYERKGAIVTFALPETGGTWQLTNADGTVMPVQEDESGNGTFILPILRASESVELRLEKTDRAPLPSVKAELADGLVRFTTGGRQVTAYHAAKNPLPRADIDSIYHRAGYLHPVYTPAGRMVTDDYPPTHVHHHGIWAAWTNTEFQGRTPDFWNMGAGTGRVELVALDETWNGPVHAGLRARHRYVDLTLDEPVTALNEWWAMRMYDDVGAAYNVFDLSLWQTPAGTDTLRLPSFRYGGVGFRGHRDWDGEENTHFLTSEGRNRSDGHGTRARWCHIGGMVDGSLVGIAILSHPDNRRAPQPMRIHPTEPFFNFAPTQAGDMVIVPETRYKARYRFVVYDTPPDEEELDRLWNDYARPPTVRVEL